MEGLKDKLKVYCETSFWSYLNGGRTPLEHIAVKQAATLKWWNDIAPTCDIFVSEYVDAESDEGGVAFAERRKASMQGAASLDGSLPSVRILAKALLRDHAVPVNEVADAFHIATAAIHGMDVLLTWNCRHMANPVTLPKTVEIIANAGFHCPIIITPADFLERKEEFGYGR